MAESLSSRTNARTFMEEASDAQSNALVESGMRPVTLLRTIETETRQMSRETSSFCRINPFLSNPNHVTEHSTRLPTRSAKSSMHMTTAWNWLNVFWMEVYFKIEPPPFSPRIKCLQGYVLHWPNDRPQRCNETQSRWAKMVWRSPLMLAGL